MEALDRGSNPFSDVLDTILEIVKDVEFLQSSKNDSDYDTQFEKAYDQLKDHEDRVYSKLTALLEADCSQEEQKNVKQSVLLREAGNRSFKEERFAEALAYYNKSIKLAPCPEELGAGEGEYLDLAISLVNRN